MSRRRAKERRRKKAGAGAPSTPVTPPASRMRGPQEAESTPEGGDKRPELLSWRQAVGDLIARLQDWSRQNYGPAIDRCLQDQFGETAATGQGASEQGTDLQRAALDFVCSPGSADGQSSILSVFVDQALDLPQEVRDQARRWQRERRRGVFQIQHCMRDQLSLWDPLEGAPLTLHLLDKLSSARAKAIRRGAIVTVSFQPWMARLVAVGEPEFFSDPRALALFREQTLESGAAWQEAPAPAPQRSR